MPSDEHKHFSKLPSGWPAPILQAQEVTHYEIARKSYRRIPYGDEPEDWGANDGLATIAELSRDSFMYWDVMWSVVLDVVGSPSLAVANLTNRRSKVHSISNPTEGTLK
jgi:hypothetical protein